MALSQMPSGLPPAVAIPYANSRLPRWALPVGLGVTALAGCAYVSQVDQSGGPVICPIRSATGYDCPGCGIMRSTHALFGGRFGDAVDHNALWVLFIAPVLIVLYVWWAAAALGWSVPRVAPRAWWGVAAWVGFLAFAVIRNLDGFGFLHSGLS
ncbi:MAG: DUF2752 domain-containing protein [Acidimicrobiales bacterium]